MFSCKKLFKLQIRPPSLMLLITTSQDRGIFPSQSWEVRNSMMMMMMIIIIIIPPAAWMFVRCEWCVLSGRGLCDELITRPEESYRLWRVVCDLETLWIRRPWPTGGCRANNKQTYTVNFIKLVSQLGSDIRSYVFTTSATRLASKR